MTQAQRRTYSRLYQKMLDALEVKHIAAIKKALDAHVRDILHVHTSGGHASMAHLINPHITIPLKRMYADAGLLMARKVRQDLRLEQRKAAFGTNDELVAMILDYLNRYLLDKSVRRISETTRQWVLRQISNGLAQGKSAYETAKEITGADFTKMQALRVVRTESTRATNVGAMKAADASPFETEKEWIAAHDNRTRHSHRRIDGQVVDMEERFSNGLLQPGDPEGSAAEVVNCRCVAAVRPKRDENGRLIRKRQNIAA